MRSTICILGTPVDVLNKHQVLERLEEFIQEKTFHQVATANADFIVNNQLQPAVRHILQRCDLVVPDGMPLVWASRRMRCPLPERVTGADLVPDLIALAAQKGYRVCMLGAEKGVAEKAKARMLQEHPTLQIAGWLTPEKARLEDMDHDGLTAQINAVKPDILFVAFGNPKQEKWIDLNRSRLQSVPVCIGVGGTFDFIAGHTHRAPMLWQKLGLEWLYRLKEEPRRLTGRYMKDIRHFIPAVINQTLSLRSVQSNQPFDMNCVGQTDGVIINCRGDLSSPECLQELWDTAVQAFGKGSNVTFDLGEVSGLNTRTLGMWLELWRLANMFHLELRLSHVPPRLVAVLRASLMDDLFFFQ